MQRDLWAAVTRPSLFICPNPSHTPPSVTTERVNKVIPMLEASGLRQLPAKGESTVVIPRPLGDEVSIGRNQIGLLSGVHFVPPGVEFGI
jgi:hypothetical protein